MSSDILEKTKKALRAVLISAPRGVPARMLCRDFKCVMGEELPYRELGFNRMEDFLKSIPDVARLGNGATGELTYFGVADAKTSQISRFVATQKKPKIKKSGAPPSIQKPSTSAFTKKSRYGPISKPKTWGGSSGGARNRPVATPGNRTRRPSNNTYMPPARARQQQQQQQQSASRTANPFIGNSINTRSSSVGNASGTSLMGGSFASGGSGGPRTSGSSTVASHTSGTPRSMGGTPAGHAKQAGTTPEYRNQLSNNRNQNFDLRNQLSGSLAGGFGSSSTSSAGKREFYGRLYDAKNFNAKFLDIAEINNGVKEKKNLNRHLCTEGYIAAEMRKDKKGVKYLLYNSFKATKGGFPAVLLNFAPDNWDVDNEGADMCHIPVGSRIRVEGIIFTSVNKKNCPEPGLKVVYYSYCPTGSASGKNNGGIDGASPPTKTPASSKSSAPTLAPYSGDFPTLIYDLLKAKLGGVWSKRFSKEFEIFYKMAAPPDVSAKAVALPFVEKSVVAEEDNPILQLKKDVAPPSVCVAPPSGAESSDESEVFSEAEVLGVEDVSPSSSTSFTTSKPPLPSVVELKSEEYFDVYVSHINSPTSFYVQHIGGDNANELTSMVAQMGRHLSMNQIKPMTPVCENELYGYKWVEEDEEEESWCRVLVSSLHTPSSGGGRGPSKQPEQMATVYFPDYGNAIEVDVEELLELPREFYNLPFQAVHCLLHGCEGESSDKATQVFMDLALDKTCVAQVMNSYGTRVGVELINIENGDSEGSTINSQVMYALHPIISLRPKLPKCGEPRVAITLSDIDEEGILTVQVHGAGLSRLQELMTLINNKFQKKAKAADFVPKDKIKEGDVYCGQYSMDKKFYRVKVKKVLPNELLVEFVDYGNEQIIDVKKLRNPHQNKLFDLPFQAVQCRLDGLPAGSNWSMKAHYWMASFLDHENLHLSVVKEGSKESLPLVRITAINSLEDDEEEEVVLNDDIISVLSAEEDTSDSSESLSSNLSKLSMKESTPSAGSMAALGESTSRASSDLFVFEGNSDSSPTVRRTASSAPVTPHIPISDSLEAGRLKSPKSATGGHPYDFKKAMFEESSPPYKFNFMTAASSVEDTATAIGEDTVVLGSKRSALSDKISISSKIGPKIKTSPRDVGPLNGPGGCGYTNGQLTPVSGKLSSDCQTPVESASLSQATPSSALSPSSSESEVSKSKSGNSVSIATPPSLISSPRSPSGSVSNSEASMLGNTPDSVVEECDKGLETSIVISEVDAKAVAKAKSGLQFATFCKEKSTVPVVVTWVTSPHDFVVQQISAVESLNNLEAKLNEPNLLSSLSSSAHVGVGDLCLACSSLDDRFYRAIAMSSNDKEVTVEFLDYGNREVTPISKLKCFPPSGCDIPFQGLVCSLKGVRPVADGWSQKELEYFDELVMDKNFFAVELSKEGGKSCVALLDTSGSETLDITEVMKAAFPLK